MRLNHLLMIYTCGAVSYVCVPHPKMLENHSIRGYFMGFTKSRVLICWLDPSTNQVKHAFAVRFDEHQVRLSSDEQLSPGSLLLAHPDSPTLVLPECSVDLSNMPHFDSAIFSFELFIPKSGSSIGCVISTDTYYNLPYISTFLPGTPLAQILLHHGSRHSSFWVLSINSKEFIKAEALVQYLRLLQQPVTTSFVTAY